MNVAKDSNTQKKKDDAAPELESHFILRLPEEPAKGLRQALQAGATNIKDKLSIQLEPDMRHGIVRLDNWVLPAKLVDLPTITESLKSIDRKNFYKTADICQMLICREDDDTTEEEDSPPKGKGKKDPNRKFLWPHGLTPPLKNVRRRRFRKTLRKKMVDAPEIEKEVKRLLRVDNEAESVRFEILTEEDERIKEEDSSKLPYGEDSKFTSGIGEHEIFGEALSDSEEEEEPSNILIDEDSRASASEDNLHIDHLHVKEEDSSESGEISFRRWKKEFEDSAGVGYSSPKKSAPDRRGIEERLETLQKELMELNSKRQSQQVQLTAIDNNILRQKFLAAIEAIEEQEREREREYKDLLKLLEDS